MALGACFETLFRRLRRRYLGIALCELRLKYSGRDVICGSIQKANGCLSLSQKQEVSVVFLRQKTKVLQSLQHCCEIKGGRSLKSQCTGMEKWGVKGVMWIRYEVTNSYATEGRWWRSKAFWSIVNTLPQDKILPCKYVESICCFLHDSLCQ
jgi:hypothetical protein